MGGRWAFNILRTEVRALGAGFDLQTRGQGGFQWGYLLLSRVRAGFPSQMLLMTS